MTLEEKLLDGLQTRKEYIQTLYEGENKVIATFEVNTLIKIVNKYLGKPVPEEKTVRVKRKRKTERPKRKRKKRKIGFFD